MGKFKVASILLTVLFLAAAPAWAGHWYIGGGFESVSVELEGTDVINDGSGFTFSFGYEFSPSLALDFLWGASVHDEDALGGDVAYGRFAFGPKFSLTASPQFKPFATIGIMGNVIDFDFFDEIDGTGLYFGIGTDFYINPSNAIVLGIRVSSWTGEDTFFEYDMDTTVVSIVYNYHFVQ